jgi:hypothetical protein
LIVRSCPVVTSTTYNAAIEERREAWRKCGVSVNYYEQEAELPGIKETMPEYAEVHTNTPRGRNPLGAQAHRLQG